MAAYVNGSGVRPGYVVKYNDKIYRVLTSEHRSPGKGRAFCQVKLRNLLDGLQTEVKFCADEQVERLSLEQMKMEYLYNDPSGHCASNDDDCWNYLAGTGKYKGRGFCASVGCTNWQG